MKILALFVFIIQNAFSNELPSQDALNSDQVVSNVSENSRSQFVPKDRVLTDIKIEKNEINNQEINLEENIKKSREILSKISGESTPKTDQVTTTESAPKRNNNPPKKKVIDPVITPTEEFNEFESGIYVLNTPIASAETEVSQSITLPSGSTALGTLMAGVEVSTEVRQVDARLDYAFLGPNGAVVELKGCHLWLDVSGNYNTERIYGDGKTISCRTSKGNTFEIPVIAQLRDYKDEYIGKKAELITRGKVASAALQFLQSGVSEFGKAMAAAQVSTDISTGGINSNPQTASNVTGSDARYITGKALAGASANFLDWWIDYYKGLSPTLAMAPGSKIFLTIKGEVQIPEEFFTETKLNDKALLRNNSFGTLSPKGETDEKD